METFRQCKIICGTREQIVWLKDRWAKVGQKIPGNPPHQNETWEVIRVFTMLATPEELGEVRRIQRRMGHVLEGH